MPDLMISYAREDKDFVNALQQSLHSHDRSTWVDWQDLPPTAPVRQEIFDAIAEASAVVLVLTPNWVESTYCRQEFDHALHLNKRLIPLLVRDVDDSKVPPQLNDINWISFKTLAFEAGIAQVLKAYDLDLEHMRLHADLYHRAEKWLPAEDPSILLHGKELTDAETWLTASRKGEGEATPLHIRFILESRRASTASQRRLLAGVSLALLLTIGLALTATLFYRSAEARRKVAQSRLLASEAVARDGNQADVALLLASHAYGIDPTVESRSALLTLLLDHEHLRKVLQGAQHSLEGIALNADGSQTAAGDSSGHVLLWAKRHRIACGVLHVGAEGDRERGRVQS